MLVTNNREKLIDAISLFSKKTKHCGLTKLFKLLYFLDFIHFRETGQTVTGLDYYAWDFGPVPQDLFLEIKNNPQNLSEYIEFQDVNEIDIDGMACKSLTRIIRKKGFKGLYFTEREKRIVKDLVYIFKDATTDEMVEISHLKGTPWETTKRERGLKKHIDYMLAMDGSDDKQLSADELSARLEEMREAKKVFD